jgi:hypothetical protein
MLADWLPGVFRPDRLIAARSRRGSARPRETLAPLARRMRVRIDASFDDEQPGDLAGTLLGNDRWRGKNIVVAWRHGTLPALARALGARRVPTSWPSRRYNWIWELIVVQRARARMRILTQPPLRTQRRATR